MRICQLVFIAFPKLTEGYRYRYSGPIDATLGTILQIDSTPSELAEKVIFMILLEIGIWMVMKSGDIVIERGNLRRFARGEREENAW